MVKYVSLGSDCAIAHQLAKHSLRQVAYPFDNVKVPKITNLLAVLNDDFQHYCDFTPVSTKSCYQHLDDDETVNEIVSSNSTVVLQNPYGIVFPHDCSSTQWENFDETKSIIVDRYNRRTERFRNLNEKGENVIFIWYEQRKVSNVDIMKLEAFFENKYPKLVWNLIVICRNFCKFTSNRVQYVCDDSEFGNWSKPNLEWATIFGMRTKIRINSGQQCSPTIHPAIVKHHLQANRTGTYLYANGKIYEDDDEYEINGYRLSVKHFSQASTRMQKHLDNIITNILPSTSNYLGIDGMTAYYAFLCIKHNANMFNNIQCYLPFPNMVDSANANLPEGKSVHFVF